MGMSTQFPVERSKKKSKDFEEATSFLRSQDSA